jgi:rhodanese-related sulfurtransferase
MMPINPQVKQRTDIGRLLRQGAVLLDVRTCEEFVGFHFRGAINIPYEEIDNNMETILRLSQPVVVYSSDGRRSRLAAIKLSNRGVTVFNAGSCEELGAWLGAKVSGPAA